MADGNHTLCDSTDGVVGWSGNSSHRDDSSHTMAPPTREAAAMYSREKRVLLREYLELGWSKSALAEKLGISRWTVHHWISTGQLDRELDDRQVVYKSRPPVERKIN